MDKMDGMKPPHGDGSSPKVHEAERDRIELEALRKRIQQSSFPTSPTPSLIGSQESSSELVRLAPEGQQPSLISIVPIMNGWVVSWYEIQSTSAGGNPSSGCMGQAPCFARPVSMYVLDADNAVLVLRKAMAAARAIEDISK